MFKPEEYTDKYFLRSREILEKEGMNPIVSLKVFCRKDIKMPYVEDMMVSLRHMFDMEGVTWWAREAHTEVKAKEPMMIIEGPAQKVVVMETLYLGMLCAIIQRFWQPLKYDPSKFTEILDGKPWLYFGARHYPWWFDETLGAASLEGGAMGTSTDAGSRPDKGLGTIPHFLVLCFAHRYGKENASVETIKSFDKHMPPEVPRILLVDTFNREIDDALAACEALGDRLDGFRIDTCGENYGQGALGDGDGSTYLGGRGVTISGVRSLRKALMDAGHGDKSIVLSSGFSNPEKLQAFCDADEMFYENHGVHLFQSVGIGGVLRDYIATTSDIYAIDGEPMTKTGREIDMEEMAEWKSKMVIV